MDKQLTAISIELLHGHKDNPRKDIGDVTELVESIKANGILQNLTVVPDGDGKYTVIIGHRRLAASKKAGLTELPCAIVEMSEEEQLSTMLTENMQRADLTIYEQAQTFQQLQFDFGLSEAEIAKRSGFSQTTVRNRIKLTKLDKDGFKKAVKRGASISDFEEIFKLKREDARQRLLECVGTVNFKNRLKIELEEEKLKDWIEETRAKLQAFATEIEKAGEVNGKVVPMSYIGSIGKDFGIKELLTPPTDGSIIYYNFGYRSFSIYKKHEKTTEEIEKEQTEKILWAKDGELEEKIEAAKKRHFELRKDFILSYKQKSDKEGTLIMQFIAECVIASLVDYANFLDTSFLHSMSDTVEGLGLGGSNKASLEKVFDWIESDKSSALKIAFWFNEMHHGKDRGFCGYTWENGMRLYSRKNDEVLKREYALIEKLGYEISDEERGFIDGTHDIFVRMDEINQKKKEIKKV